MVEGGGIEDRDLRRDIGLTGHILKKLKISRECTSASER
jgi:hypothetical protein